MLLSQDKKERQLVENQLAAQLLMPTLASRRITSGEYHNLIANGIHPVCLGCGRKLKGRWAWQDVLCTKNWMNPETIKWEPNCMDQWRKSIRRYQRRKYKNLENEIRWYSQAKTTMKELKRLLKPERVGVSPSANEESTPVKTSPS